MSAKFSFVNSRACTSPLAITVAERTDLSKKLISPISSPLPRVVSTLYLSPMRRVT